MITDVELEAAERGAGLTVEAGDALFVHTGLTTRLATAPDDADHRAGLGIDAVLWLRERDVALFGGDCVELLPGPDPDVPLPRHQLGTAPWDSPCWTGHTSTESSRCALSCNATNSPPDRSSAIPPIGSEHLHKPPHLRRNVVITARANAAASFTR